MAEFELRTYVDEHGRVPFETWILELDGQAQAKVTIALSRLERGNMSNVEAVGEGVSELKLNWGPGYRVYFGQDGKITIILLCVRRNGKAGTLLSRKPDGEATSCVGARHRDEQ